MKKSLTLTLILAALAVFSGLGVAQQGEKQKSPTTRIETKPAPTPTVALKPTTVKSGKSNSDLRVATAPQVMTGKVTQVNAREKTFAVEASFSAGRMLADYGFKVGDTIDVTYTQTPGGPMLAVSVKSGKSNGNEREATAPQVMTGKVTQVNAREKTFAVEASFSAGRMNGDFAFKVGDTIDVTYTQTPGGPMLATTVRSTKSNSSF